MAYRVPRRFIVAPEEPPPYGLLLLSFLGHMIFLLMAGAVSSYLGQADQSKIYIVNLAPAVSPPVGTPTPRVAERAAPPKESRERPTPPPRAERKPRPAKRVARQAEPPPPREIPKPEKAATPTPPRPSELTLPRRVEKRTPELRTPVPPRARFTARTPPPPRPSAPTPPVRAPEPLRVARPARPPARPVVAPRPGLQPMPLGQPIAGPSAKGTLSLDVSDFPFTYYLRQIQAKISERWTPPRGAVAGGEKVVILFEIDRDGRSKSPSVEHSSGNALYDQSALRAVMEASPFPPLPPEFRAPSLRVHFGFEFQPDQG